MLIMSHAGGAGVTQTVQINFVPQFLAFTVATAPSLVKVTPLGDGPVTDLDAAGVLCLGRIRRYAVIANMYVIPVADGLIRNKTTELIITSAAAGAFSVYAMADRYGENYIQCIRQTVLANSPQPFRQFHFLGLPSIGANDTLDITFLDGLTHKYTRDELQYLITETQNDTTGYNIDNVDPKSIDTVLVNVGVTQTVYVARTSMAGAVQKGIM